MSEHVVFECGGGYTFEQNGEKGIFFPNYMRIVMDRGAAWDIFHALSHELMDDDRTVLQVYIHGKISPEREDEA